MNDPRPPPLTATPPLRSGVRPVRDPRQALRGPNGVFARSERDPRSLFGEMLDWVLAPLLFLWPMSLALTWIVAQNIAHQPYDAELARLVQALAAHVTVGREPLIRRPGRLQVAAEIERTAQTMVFGDDELQRWFQVLGRRGEFLAGDAALAVPTGEPEAAGTVYFRDDVLHDDPVRVAYLWLGASNGDRDNDALVQVAETLVRRERLAIDIIKGVLLPQFLILPLAVMLVWLALSRGFRPLEELQQRIRRRQSTDLSPIPERDVPEEVAPLVRSINDLLQRLDRSMAIQRQFLADAAHQLKTPLAGLRMQAELAEREIDGGRGDPKSMKHSLRQIAVSSQRAAHMVNQLLSMARADADSTTLRPQWVELGAIARAVVRDFVPRAMERRIDLGYEGPEDETGAARPARLMAEPVLLGELVRNLVDNALQYTPAGGTVTARVCIDPAGDAVVLEVEDTGPGIAPSERDLVFRPFYRALGTLVDGSGLGLAIVQEVAMRHGATVSIDDARPRSGETADSPGVRFTVRLPRGTPDAGTLPA
ncbi:MAG: sensor histidine kinase N-terminal domain-containing protein [Burkholderiales bacterium]|nr:sensor histidine kinase N-terminal domain-containing protein [Burkholderiales bacterium]